MTDADGTSFLVEVQRKQQSNFKERSLFYASRLISDQAQKGKQWKHELKAVYVISLLENFSLPETKKDVYLHNVALCDTNKGMLFYDKLHFTYIELKKFKKTEPALETGLDKWLYVLKNAYAMTEDPGFINEGKIKDFFELARQANFTTEERNMYRNAQQVAWDNYNALDYAKKKARKKGREEERLKIAKELKAKGADSLTIAEVTKLSIEQIQAL